MLLLRIFIENAGDLSGIVCVLNNNDISRRGRNEILKMIDYIDRLFVGGIEAHYWKRKDEE